MAKVINLYKEPYDVYIGRGSIWGNPYSFSKKNAGEYAVSSREEAIEKYKDYLRLQIKNGSISLEELASLKGKTLGCFCKPKPCHGDILAIAVDWAVETLDSPL